MSSHLERARKMLIVALDYSDRRQALKMADQLSHSVGAFKVGLQLFSACGPKLVGSLVQKGFPVFLDLKLHDIPNTVAAAAVEGARLGVEMITLHTLGGKEMLKAARNAVDTFCLQENRTPPMLLGVTVLTSMNRDQLSGLGIRKSLPRLVLHLARLAQAAGLDGIVCSPLEVAEIRKDGLANLKLVVPGIRPAGSTPDDQSRTMTAFETVRSGADFLVVGRPLTRSRNPAEAAQKLVEEIAHAKMFPR